MADLYSIVLNGSQDLSRTEDFKPSSVTYECWVKPVSVGFTITSGFRNDISFGVDGDSHPFLSIWNGASYTTVTDTGTIAVGAWTHIAVTWDGNSVKFYINGSPTGTGSATVSYEADSGFTYSWGSRNGAFYFTGKLDEARMWLNTVRSASDILNNYNIELVGNETGLYAYYRFEQNPNDTTANARTLTANGSPVYSADTHDHPMGGGAFLLNMI